MGGFLMDFKTIIDLLSRSNINQEAMYELVGEASSLDLSDESNLRKIIQKGATIAGKTIPVEQEDKLISLLKEKGITSDLLNILK
jgi:hypothetical protein